MIRLCDYSDLNEIAVIHSDNIKNTYKGFGLYEYIANFSPEERHNILSNYMSNINQRMILVYERDKEILGFIAFHFRSAEKCGNIKYLHVKRAAQRKGIGKSLIRAAMGVFWRSGINKVIIEAMANNENALLMYKSLGAVELSRYTTMSYGTEICNVRLLWEDISELADVSPELYIYNVEFSDILKKDFVLFGAGSWCDEFMKQFPDFKPSKIFENDSSKWGTFKNGIPIVSPQKNDNVIITSILYQEIRNQLKDLGCENIADFCP